MILNKYILKEHLTPFIFAIIIFSFIFVINKFSFLGELIVLKKLAIIDVGKLLLYYLLPPLSITIGISALIASLMAWGRLSGDYELIAMRAAGLSLLEPIRLIIIISLFLSIATLIFNELITTHLLTNVTAFYKEIIQRQTGKLFEPGGFVVIGGKEIYVDEVDRTGTHLKGIYIYNREGLKNLRSQPSTIYAHSGEVIKTGGGNLIVRLINGTIHQVDEDDPLKYYLVTFDTHTIKLLLPEKDESRIKSIEWMSIQELWQLTGRCRVAGLEIRPLMVELARKMALPFSAFASVLIGIPLGLISKANKPMIGFGWSIPVIFTYYLFLIMGEAFGINGVMNPMVAMWLPNITMGGIGIILLVLIAKR